MAGAVVNGRIGFEDRSMGVMTGDASQGQGFLGQASRLGQTIGMRGHDEKIFVVLVSGQKNR
jgi:hypothetical protein